MPRESHLLSHEAAPLLVSVLPLLSHHIRDGLFRIPEFLAAVIEKRFPPDHKKHPGHKSYGNGMLVVFHQRKMAFAVAQGIGELLLIHFKELSDVPYCVSVHMALRCSGSRAVRADAVTGGTSPRRNLHKVFRDQA